MLNASVSLNFQQNSIMLSITSFWLAMRGVVWTLTFFTGCQCWKKFSWGINYLQFFLLTMLQLVSCCLWSTAKRMLVAILFELTVCNVVWESSRGVGDTVWLWYVSDYLCLLRLLMFVTFLYVTCFPWNFLHAVRFFS